jgi:hypothetical protein
VCLLCSPGQYNADTGRTKCDSCLAGSAQPNSGNTTCVSCEENFFSTDGSANCQPCPPRSFNRLRGNSRCESCGEGTYFSASTASCLPCPEDAVCFNGLARGSSLLFLSTDAFGVVQAFQCSPGRFVFLLLSLPLLVCSVLFLIPLSFFLVAWIVQPIPTQLKLSVVPRIALLRP